MENEDFRKTNETLNTIFRWIPEKYRFLFAMTILVLCFLVVYCYISLSQKNDCVNRNIVSGNEFNGSYVGLDYRGSAEAIPCINNNKFNNIDKGASIDIKN